MNEAIQRAQDPNVTIEFIQEVGITESSILRAPNQEELQQYFNALLAEPCSLSVPNGVVALLKLTVRYFCSNVAGSQECFCYLKSVARHGDSLCMAIARGYEERAVSDIVQAAGNAATKISARSMISSSGVIPVLKELALCASTSTNRSNVSDNDISMHADSLTSAHVEFLQTCLAAGHYRYAAAFADKNPVYSVKPDRHAISVEQYLRYFYLLGMIYCGCGDRWADAVKSFNICITAPSQLVSAITLAAYKKCMFASLLHDNKKIKLPESTSAAVSRFISSTSDFGLKEYHKLVDAFVSDDVTKYSEFMTSQSELLTSDGNFGLAQQVLDEFQPKMVRKLAHVYEIISLSKLASKLNLSGGEREAERLIMRMISKNGLSASIDQLEGNVAFYTGNGMDEITEDAALELSSRTAQCIELARRMKELDIALSTTAKYQSKIMKQSETKASGSNLASSGDERSSVAVGGGDAEILEGGGAAV
eukprot:CAMPEP_0196807066 /NCGR_PEP_ID=MMETSP1362-20130617/7008_1 /TAXON_ID=163516 /ORGANISM="Leptocylindrus danicus, Strain CCMP1856" /LENGTH=479 /DNA_ID=CAMNT_0042180823 /DNA_START=5 /DNA_END=1444 /DNA_ORIENTATION=+